MVCESIGFLSKKLLIMTFLMLGMGTMFYTYADDGQATGETAAGTAAQAGDAQADAAKKAGEAAQAGDAQEAGDAQADAAKGGDAAAAEAAAQAEEAKNAAEEKPCGSISEESISQLQAESTITADKLPIMQSLADLSKEEAQKCLQVVTGKEMIALTVIELARHSDKALAEKAKAVEANFDIKAYVDASFADPAGQIPNDIITLLLRIEPERVGIILSGLSPEKKQAIEKKLSYYVPTILIPTGSKEGDRYHVKILWDKEDSEQMDCLAKVLHEELDDKQSVEEQRRLMETRGHRIVYSINKGWAIHIFDRALRCKATPSFVRN